MSASSKLAAIVDQFDQAAKEQEDRVQQAIAAGGLPTEEERETVYQALQAAWDAVESIVLRIEGICETELGDDLPFVVTYEQIGVVSAIAEDADTHATYLREFAERIQKKRGELPAIRAEQVARANRTEA